MGSSPEFEHKREWASDPAGPKPLDSSVRSTMERALDADLGGVRIHSDDAAYRAADSLGAQAFTRQQEIYFARDRYQPDTQEGKSLLAHELAHTVQQTKTHGEAAGKEVLEAEAEQAAFALQGGPRIAIASKAPANDVQKKEMATPAASQAATARNNVIEASPAAGSVTAGGYAIDYSYTVSNDSKQVALTLRIPEGATAAVTPLTEMKQGADYSVQNAEGTKARALVVTVRKDVKTPAKIQLTIMRGNNSDRVVFQFPIGSVKN